MYKLEIEIKFRGGYRSFVKAFNDKLHAENYLKLIANRGRKVIGVVEIK